MEEWHYCEYSEEHKAWGYYHNPNAKWDWHTLGGRWSGFFKLKEGARGKLGEFSILNQHIPTCSEADQAYMQDIDWQAMKDTRNARSDEAFREIMRYYRTIEMFLDKDDEYIVNFLKTTSRKDLPEAVERVCTETYFLLGYEVGDTMEEQRLRRSYTTFAVLHEGEWYEKGEMGWWAVVTNAKSEAMWNREWEKLVMALPGNTLLSIFDCHI